MKDNVVQETIVQTKNTNNYNWEVPKKQKTGSTYSLRLSNSNNNQQASTTDVFTIKPKIPLLVKIAIPVVAAVVVGVLVSGGGSGAKDDPNTNTGLEELPGPINPGGG